MSKVGKLDRGSVILDLKCRRSFFVHEEPVVMELFSSLQEALLPTEHDTWRWKHARDDYFTVATAYQALVNNNYSHVESANFTLYNHSAIWDSWASYKFQVFSWQLLRERFPFKETLFKWKVTTDLNDYLCTFCGEHVVSASHLFMACSLMTSVWYRIFGWVGVQLALLRDLDLDLVSEIFVSLHTQT